MIVNGHANAVVYDSYTAHREGKQSTGHASGGAGVWGPLPRNVFLAPGDADLDAMIADTPRGILVTRFHYTNVLHPVKTVFTGMTRDGTFWIENGQVAHPVKNLRFTQSILDALDTVSAIGRETKLQAEGGACRYRHYASMLSSFPAPPSFKTARWESNGAPQRCGFLTIEARLLGHSGPIAESTGAPQQCGIQQCEARWLGHSIIT